MSFPKYDAYKDSGCKALGSIPTHWKVCRFHYAIEFQEGPGIMAADFHDEGIPLIRVSGMGGRFVSLDGCNYLSQEKVERQWNHFRVNQGDLLISASASMGTVSEVDDASVGSVPYTGLIRLWPKPGGCISDFIRALVVSDLFGKQIDVLKAGATIQHFGPTHLRQIVVAVPPLEEQKAIAKFLDAETSKIDALVAEQRRLIELLAEKRQAVISHAVTKGLDPNVRMKPSGIEWLGDVPEHWEVTLLKRIAIVRTGVAKGKDHSGKETIEVPYLRVANVQDGFFDLTQVAKIEILEHELERYRLAAGDVLMNEGGDFDKLGRGHVWEGQIDPCITQNHVFAVRPTGVTAHWLNRITSSEYAQFYFMTRSKQSTNLASISSTNLMKLPVVLPPESEQFEILDFIDKSTKQFDSLLAEAEQAITLLQERRTALISAAVTGKIDVRARQY